MQKSFSGIAVLFLAGLLFFFTACTPENQPEANAETPAAAEEPFVERTVPNPEDMTPDDALEFLLEGNRRFREHHQQHITAGFVRRPRHRPIWRCNPRQHRDIGQ